MSQQNVLNVVNQLQNVVQDVKASGTAEGKHSTVQYESIFNISKIINFNIFRECQVKHWSKHKKACDMIHAALSSAVKK